MTGKLQREIKQSTPFPSREAEAFLNLQHTADVLLQRLAELLKPSGISPTQYNVLRILRGAGPEGLPCGEVSNRMITREPDMTRLLDRMEKRGLVTRARQSKDRRVVTAQITPRGLETLKTLDCQIERFHRERFARLGERLDDLIAIMETLRENGMSKPSTEQSLHTK